MQDQWTRIEGRCGFQPSHHPPCPNELPCEQHGDKVCGKCGKRARNECGYERFFICGEPQCAMHRHCHYQSYGEMSTYWQEDLC